MTDRYIVPMPCRECKFCIHGALYRCTLGYNCEFAIDRYEFHHAGKFGYNIYQSCASFVQQKLNLIPANDVYDRFMQMKFDFSEQ